jgi:hypothetical protein
VAQPVGQRVESAPRPAAITKVETNCRTPKQSPTFTSPNTLIRMKPGANTAMITKRKYQMMNRVHTGLTKDP